ncbi:hypothetical protein ABID21_004875 [Pseudorhizobium tarimense]|uniref:CRISPR-associated endonuclease/helicase Cas3 n=1 Tax=Pseudorhizobium tarimense TaxID=1079109 RepID=A0ABV2HEA6_9HYPH
MQQLLLEHPDLRTQRRLGNAQPACRSAEVRLLGHCHDVGKLA